jgi:broad specificity phosphatase PhoE
MKKYFILLLIGCSTFTSTLQAQDFQESTTYYFIRHAEKVLSKTDRDPKLQPIGEERAHRWAKVFSNIKLDAIYSTNYKRTLATAQPTAESKGIVISNYHAKEINYKQFKKDTQGKSVLIVGHSNTIPTFVNALIGNDKYPDIAHNNNGNLYIVELINGQIIDKVLYIQ